MNKKFKFKPKQIIRIFFILVITLILGIHTNKKLAICTYVFTHEPVNPIKAVKTCSITKGSEWGYSVSYNFSDDPIATEFYRVKLKRFVIFYIVNNDNIA